MNKKNEFSANDNDELIEDVIDIDEEIDEDAFEEEKSFGRKKAGTSKRLLKLAVPAVAGICVVAALGTVAVSQMKSNASEKKAQEAVTEYLTDNNGQLTAQIEEAIEKYEKENQATKLADFLDQKGQQELMDSILADMADMELSDTQKSQLKEALSELLATEDSIKISGKAVFTDESKAYLTSVITKQLEDTLSEYAFNSTDYKELVEKYGSLDKAIDKIISEQIGSAKVTYTITDADKQSIRESIISSLGNMKGSDGKDGTNGRDGVNGKDGAAGKDGINGKDGSDGKDGIDGKDGANGRDGRDGRDGEDGIDGEDGKDGVDGQDGSDGKDGRDGRDGKDGVNGTDGRDGRDGADGYTPVKGTDYFTDAEIDKFVSSIELNVKSYFDTHEIEEIKAMTDSIKADIMEVFNTTTDTMEDDIKDTVDNVSDLCNIIGTEPSGGSSSSGGESSGGSNNVFSESTVYKEGDIIVRGGTLYQCTEDMSEAGEWDESKWKVTDLVTVNNYYNEKLSESEAEMRKDYNGKISSLEQSISDLINRAISGLTKSIEDTASATDERINALESQTDEKISDLESQTDEKISNLDSQTDEKISNLDSQTDEKVNNLDNSTNQKLDELDASTSKKIDEASSNADSRMDGIEADTGSKITAMGDSLEAKISNLTASINEKIESLRQSIADTIASLREEFTAKFTEVDQKMEVMNQDIERIESEEATYELIENADGTYTLNITDPKTSN